MAHGHAVTRWEAAVWKEDDLGRPTLACGKTRPNAIGHGDDSSLMHASMQPGARPEAVRAMEEPMTVPSPLPPPPSPLPPPPFLPALARSIRGRPRLPTALFLPCPTSEFRHQHHLFVRPFSRFFLFSSPRAGLCYPLINTHCLNHRPYSIRQTTSLVDIDHFLRFYDANSHGKAISGSPFDLPNHR